MKNRLEFQDAAACAKFCAELMRQGVAFTGHQCGSAFVVILTGY